MYAIIPQRRRWYLASAALLIPGVLALAVWGLNIGIDFKGGVLQQVRFSEENRPTTSELTETLSTLDLKGLGVQSVGERDVQLRFAAEASAGRELATQVLTATGAEEVSFQLIGSSVAKNATQRAGIAVLVTALTISLYLAYGYRRVPKPLKSWQFSAATVVALAHDLVFVLGMYAIIGHFFPAIEVDALTITALLTVMGFSVNDTIVVFDRVRENVLREPRASFAETVNRSVNQSLARSLNTSFTILVVLVALLLLGGETIRSFTLALTLGIAVGTFSSIFTAAPLLVSWQGRVQK